MKNFMPLSNRIKIILILFSILTLLVSCSSNLSRSKAKELILKANQFPIVETFQIDIGDGQQVNDVQLQLYQSLADQKLLTFNISSQGFSDRIGKFYNLDVELTEKGEAYKVKEDSYNIGFGHRGPIYYMKAADAEFNEITGIQEKDNQATVSYNLKYTNVTPFGKGQYDNGKTEDQHAKFVKYDDGWRLK